MGEVSSINLKEVLVRLTDAQMEQLEKLSKKLGNQPKAELIREAVTAYLLMWLKELND